MDRFALDPIRKNVLDRRVPKAPWYYGDGATLAMLLTVQIVTGALMTLTYSPTPDTALQSVEYITNEQLLGWFVRGIHYWAAGMMVVMLFWHLFRLILVGGYKSPREGTWLIGVGMFMLVLTMAFTGYVLRGDERALYAFRVSLSMFNFVPWIGEDLAILVQGGREFGARTVSRVYGIHAIIIPLILSGLAAYHIYLVVVRGITSPAERREGADSSEEQKEIYHEAKESKSEGEPFYPDTMAQSGAMAMVVFLIVIVLTLIYGPGNLYPEWNLTRRSYPAEEWWFWWYSGLAALLPPAIAPWFYVLFPIGVIAALVLLPFLDRSPERGIRKRPFAVGFVVVAVVAMIFLTDLRRRSPWTGWVDLPPPEVPEGVVLEPQVEQGRQLFATYGCTSCHAVAGQGAKVGPDLARMSHRYSPEELANYILLPPEGVAMPSYEGRITEEDLDRVVQYVLVAQTFQGSRDE